MCKWSMLHPREVMKRIKSAATIVAIGPSSSGKSTLIYALVNHRVVVFINKGIGDKSRTTIIPCTFLFDERMREEQFGLQVKTRKFSSKDVHIELMEQLAILFSNNGGYAEDTLDCIDEEWINRVLEPESAAYHLGVLKDELSLEELKEALTIVLEAFENANESFDSCVRKKKEELKQQKIKITEIRRIVFAEMWDRLSADETMAYFQWIENVGNCVEKKLNALFGENDCNSICQFSVDENGLFTYGGHILEELFDPYQPYSLIVEEMTLACRPREEIIKENADLPLRFCLRDTMGLNQIDMDSNTIKDALDIALNCSPDSILLLLNLEERDDVIAESCDAIANKLKRAEKMNIPVHVFFTKADRILDNLIYKNNRKTVDIKQTDYDEHILEALCKVEESIGGYISRLPEESATWLTLRFKDENIDPIQMALKKSASDKAVRFTPQGLYSEVERIIDDAQGRILPKGMKSPLVIQVKDYDIPAVSFSIKSSVMKDVMEEIREKLTQDKAIVNRYLITTNYRIHGRSVVNYYRNLQSGQGYKTNAQVYGNFNINMKLMLYNVLCECVPRFLTLYEEQAVGTDVRNLDADEIMKMVAKFDANGRISEFAYADINPEIWENVAENIKASQKLHFVFRHYFGESEKYHMIMNKVALQLSYKNEKIKTIIDSVYMKPISYDATIREMQKTFLQVFATEEFSQIIAEEIGDAMTELVNKMFVTV